MTSSNTSLAIAQLPKPLPPFGGTLLGANTLETDSTFGTQLVRATDTNSGNAGSLDSNTTADTPDSSAVWNADDTIHIFKNAGGATFLRQFNPAAMQGVPLPKSYPFKLNGAMCFSRLEPEVFYNVANGSTVVNSITLGMVGGVWVTWTETAICDFATILPAGFVPKWQSLLSVSLDTIFCMAFSEGAQDTGFLVCLYNSSTKTYRLFNSQTLEVSEIGPTWGASGRVSLKNTSYKNFFIHGVQMTANPLYCVIAAVGNTTGGFIWPIETLKMTQPGLAGHHALGSGHIICPNTSGGQMIMAAYATPTTHVKIVPDALLPVNQIPKQNMLGDSHQAFGPINLSDQSLMFTSWGPPCPHPFTSCWMGEVVGYDVTGAVTGTQGKVVRCWHTLNSGQSKEYVVTNGQAAPSQTGRFVAFTSDLMGGFGSNDGKPVKLGENARGEVLIGRVPKIS
jgi:hypothetical protein